MTAPRCSGTATVSAGTWSYTTAALADGSHSFTAVATDTAGNSTTTAAVTATIDTTAPAETFASTIGTNTGATSTISSGGLTKDNTLALSGTVSDASGVSSVQVYDGATLLGTATVSAGTWSYTTAALADGSHSFTAVATDTAGNSTTTSAVTATIDTTAPAETFASTIGTNTGATSTISSGGLTKDNTLALSGTVSDASGVSSVQVYDGATLLGTATVSAGTWSYTTAALADGSHSFTAVATDTAGNSTTTSAVTATIDTTAPVVTESLASDTGSSSTDKITSNGTLTGSGDPNAVVHFTVDGNPIAGTATANASGIWTFTPTGLSDGSHTIVASETDAAGNTGSTSFTFTLDTKPPAVTEGLVNSKLTGSGDPNAVVHFSVDGKPISGTATANASGVWSYAPSGLATGTHTIVASETDLAGNNGNALLTISVSRNHRMSVIANATAKSSQDIGTSLNAASQSALPNSSMVLNEQALGLKLDNYVAAAQPTIFGNSSNITSGGDAMLQTDGTQLARIAALSSYIASSFVAGGLGDGGSTHTSTMQVINTQTTFLSQPVHT